MHASIMAWSSKALYRNKLVAHESVKAHLLSDLPNVTKTVSTTTPLVLIDSAGCDLAEAEGALTRRPIHYSSPPDL